jgi:hypothetical protein
VAKRPFARFGEVEKVCFQVPLAPPIAPRQTFSAWLGGAEIPNMSGLF